MKAYITIVYLTLLSTLSYSQSLSDVLRYSLYDYGSTARSIGAGSSMSPLGADLSVATTNPAGLGGFYKSEFAITAGVPLTQVKATLNQAPETEDLTTFKIQNLGAVFTSRPNSNTFKTLNVAIGVNTLANFDRDVFYSGNSNGTRVERFLELAIDKTLNELSDFEEGLAYDAELIADRDSNLVYESDFVTLDEEIYKEEKITERGSLNELYISAGSNVGDKLAVGATLGIPILNYRRTSAYLESDDAGTIANLQDFIFRQNVRSEGGGINLKVGVIYKPVPKVRLSAAVHSPTWLLITDEYSSSLNFRFDGEENGREAQSPTGNSEYIVQTPWRAMVGAGVIYKLGGLRGFLSGEVEYVDYSQAHFNIVEGANQGINPIIARNLNKEIDEKLSQDIHIKVGTEIASGHWRLRGGINMHRRAYVDKKQLRFDPGFSLGIGYRADGYYIDAAYRGISRQEIYTPYELVYEQAEQKATIASRSHQFALTFGYKM